MARGIDVNVTEADARIPDTTTPLHLAASCARPPLIAALLDAGADIEAREGLPGQDAYPHGGFFQRGRWRRYPAGRERRGHLSERPSRRNDSACSRQCPPRRPCPGLVLPDLVMEGTQPPHRLRSQSPVSLGPPQRPAPDAGHRPVPHAKQPDVDGVRALGQ